MSDPIRPGQENESLGPGLIVLRFAGIDGLNDEALRLAAEGKAQPTMFAFSEMERRLSVKSLSVWAEVITPAALAWQLSGAKLNSRVLLHLGSDEIRRVEVSPGQNLDVVWEQAMLDLPDGTATSDARPGTDGHAGIRHLEKGTTSQRKLARFRLSEVARSELLAPDLVREWAARITAPHSTDLDQQRQP
jgi:hypothetical protein